MSQDQPRQPGGNRARKAAPEPWASAMIQAGLVTRGEPSIRALAERARQFTGTSTPSPEAVRGWIHGERVGHISGTVAEAMAAALDVSTAKVMAWVESPHGHYGRWTPPMASSRLTPAQRRALDELVRLFAAANAREDEAGETRGDTAPMNVTDDGATLTVETGDADPPPRPGGDRTRPSDIRGGKRDNTGG